LITAKTDGQHCHLTSTSKHPKSQIGNCVSPTLLMLIKVLQK